MPQQKKGSSINSHPYYICSTKKKQGKSECNNDNIKLSIMDEFIENLAKNYYKNVRLSNKAKIVRLQNDLRNIKNKSVVDINNEIINIKNRISNSEDQLSKLIDGFLESSDITKKIIDKKIKNIEAAIEEDNKKVLNLERSKNTIDSDKAEIENKIKS